MASRYASSSGPGGGGGGAVPRPQPVGPTGSFMRAGATGMGGLGSPPAGEGAPGSGGAGPAYAPTSLSSFVSGPGLFR